jgi:pimeloyl-ACP methyl ester carboxylesterase
MPESARADVIGYIAKARAELAALLAEPAGEDAYRALTCPVLLLRGDRRNPAATATSRLADAIPGARLCTIRRAGHMGPMTHADSVNAAIVEHVRAADEP